MILKGNRVIVRPLMNREVLGEERKPLPILLVETTARLIYQDWFENGRYGEVVAVGDGVGYNEFLGKYRDGRIVKGDIVRLIAPMASNSGVVGDDIINSSIDGKFYKKSVYSNQDEENGNYHVFFDAGLGVVRDYGQVQMSFAASEWKTIVESIAQSYRVRQQLKISTDPEFKTNWERGIVPTSYLRPAVLT